MYDRTGTTTMNKYDTLFRFLNRVAYTTGCVTLANIKHVVSIDPSSVPAHIDSCRWVAMAMQFYTTECIGFA